MRKKWPRVLMAGMLVAVGGLYPLLAAPAHRIDKVHYALIRNGMTLEEVESILGAPPGNYDWAVPTGEGEILIYSGSPPKRSTEYFEDTPSGKRRTAHYSANGFFWHLSSGKLTKSSYTDVIWSKFVDPDLPLVTSKSWTSRHGHCTVWFDPEERVAYKNLLGSRIEPPWHNWRRWFLW